jgi:hypothetical protein
MSKDRLEEFRSQQQQHDDTVNAAKQGRHLPHPGCVTLSPQRLRKIAAVAQCER